MITLRQVEAFRAVMVTGTVTHAADMLHISQPAVSRLLSDLERTVGFRLFFRANRQLIPTAEGRALYEDVEKAFIGLDQIASAAIAIREYRRGHLRLVTIPSVVSTFAGDLVARFVSEFPDISVSLEVQPTQRVFEWIISQQCDIGLSTLPIDNSAVVTRPVLRGAAVCILPRDHRLADRGVIRPADLEGEPFISFKADSVFRHTIDNVFKAAGVRRRLGIEARTTEAICKLVGAGLGVSIIGPAFPEVEIHHGVAARPFEPAIHSDLALLYLARKPVSRATDEFIRIVEEYVAGTFGGLSPLARHRRTG
jgi:DNA-binding transcriptional LysR family regulator